MRRATVVLALAFACAAIAPSIAPAKVRKGPAGTAFYTPPKGGLAGTHGSVIWGRKLTGPVAFTGFGANELLLYRSVGVRGKNVAISGAVTLPKGKAPKNGWPVVTWAHGTTGLADQCAPTRGTGGPTNGGYATTLFEGWLKRGYALVSTDYEGLGTPGPHPYLIGRSEARSTLDMVRAAQRWSGKLNLRKVVISGHSQGGQAALWSAATAPSWTPELHIRGTVAFAPASQLETQGRALAALGPGFSGLTGLAASILRGIDIARPSLHVARYLSPRGAALYPQTLTKCLGELGATDSFGGLAPNQLFKSKLPEAAFLALRELVDPQHLKIPTPVLVEQGKSDTTVFPNFTGTTVTALRKKGAKVAYHTFAGLTHISVVTSSAVDADATKFIVGKLR